MVATRKPPPVSYDDDLSIIETTNATPVRASTPEHALEDARQAGELPAASARRPIVDKSAPTLVYIHPQGKHQLRQYAVAQGLRVKVHDLLIEALEEWGAKRGLPGPWRVPPTKRR